MGKKLIIIGADFSQVAVDTTTPIVDTFYIDNKNLPVDRTEIGGQDSSKPFAYGGLYQGNIRGKKLNCVRFYFHPEIEDASYTIGQTITIIKATYNSDDKPSDVSWVIATSIITLASKTITSRELANGYIDIPFDEIILADTEYLFINTTSNRLDYSIAVASTNPTDNVILRLSLTDYGTASIGVGYGNMPWAIGYKV